MNGCHEQHVDAAKQVVNVNDRRDSDRLAVFPDESFLKNLRPFVVV